MIRFERDGEERFAHWIGGEDWHRSLHRLFDESEAGLEVSGETGVGRAPPETIARSVQTIASMGLDELGEFEARTFRRWAPASLGDVRRAIRSRLKELAG